MSKMGSTNTIRCAIFAAVLGLYQCLADCGWNVTGDNVEVIHNNNSCTWSVEVSQNTQILLNFTNPPSLNCATRYIEVWDGDKNTTYCDDGKFAVASSSNKLSFRFINVGETLTGTTYTAVFSIFECGGRFTELSGSIQSPGFGSFYPHNVDCAYTIELPKFHTILFRTDSFDLQGTSGDICEDSVTISDRTSILGICCGTTDLSFQHSTYLSIRFRTDMKINSNGFRFSWTVCGGIFNSSNNNFQIESPVTDITTDCNYVYSAPPGEQAIVSFSQLSLGGGGGASCLPDSNFIQIFDGGDDNSPLLLSYCRSVAETPFSVAGIGKSLRVQFYNDGSVTAGIEAQAQFLSRAECGGTQTDGGGLIDLYYEGSETYPYLLRCNYDIITRTGGTIVLSFSEFSLQNEEQGHCMDYVEVKNSMYQRRYCRDELRATKLFAENKLTLNFVSDSTKSENGFRARWSACGGHFERPFGVVTPPMFPDLYEGTSKECEYKVGHPNATSLVLGLLVRRPTETGCSFSITAVGKTYTFRCPGRELRRQLVVDSNSADLRFGFDLMSLNFSISWIACGIPFTNSSGRIDINSDSYPFLSGTECSYTIMPNNAESIILQFLHMDLESSNCSDAVQIFDGRDSQSQLLDTGTGNKTPIVVSNTGTLLIKFRPSCPLTNKTGFSAVWDVCSTTLQSDSGVLTSPRYPSAYPTGITCRYTLTVPMGMIVKLTFIEFNVGVSLDNKTCAGDYIEIYKDHSNISERICGHMTSNVSMLSLDRTMVVVLTSKQDSVSNFTGFHAIFNSVVQGTLAATSAPQTTGFISYQRDYEARKGLIAYQSALAITLGVLVFVVFALAGFLVRQRKSYSIHRHRLTSMEEPIIHEECRQNGDIKGRGGQHELDDNPAMHNQGHIYDDADPQDATVNKSKDGQKSTAASNHSSCPENIGEEESEYSEQPQGIYDKLHSKRNQKSAEKDDNVYTVGVEMYGEVHHDQILTDNVYDSTVGENEKL